MTQPVRRWRRWRAVLALAGVVIVSSAHIGSPDAWFDGAAGPYRVLVHVEAPPVVPGIAIVNVNASDAGITRVTAFVNRFDATGGTPPPDIAAPVADSPGWYRTRLWVMTSGSNSVTVSVSGAKGTGSVVVPLTAVAGRRLSFDTPLATLLIIAAVVLALGMITIAGAAVRESVLPPGAQADPPRRRRARFAMMRTAIVLGLLVVGTGAWWRAEDRGFTRRLFRPMAITPRVEPAVGDARESSAAGMSRLVFTIDDSAWVKRHDPIWLRDRRVPQRGDLIEDHAKLVHLFVIAADGRRAFAHLHPTTRDSVTFESPLPPLPGGRYNVFADIVHTSGFTQTMTAPVTVPHGPIRGTTAPQTAGNDNALLGGSTADADVSWGLERRDADATTSALADGTTLTWLRGSAPLVAKAEAGLRFAVASSPGDTAALEPFLGMPGHAVVIRDDAGVFIHLHPLGTISVAAQQRLTADPARMNHAAHPAALAVTSDTLYFPYAFPQPGRYTVWVQIKRSGRVLTGSFPVEVAASPER